MPKMTKAQARKRCKECIQKAQKVFMSGHRAMTVQDMAAVEKIMYKAMNRLK